MGLYEYCYFLINIFAVYVLHKFMCVFFDRNGVEKKREIISYSLFYFFITLLYLIVRIPTVMVLANIMGYIFITFNYRSSMFKRILASLLIFTISSCVEITVAYLTFNVKFDAFSESNYSSVIGFVLSNLILHTIAIFIKKLSDLKRNAHIPSMYWVCIIVVPPSTLFVLLALMQLSNGNTLTILTCACLLLLINFTFFIVYDSTVRAMQSKHEQALLQEQNKHYAAQYNHMLNHAGELKALRHDIRNHYSVLRTLIQNDEEAARYIDSIIGASENSYLLLNSGNVTFDSIINYKINEAARAGINVEVNVAIPQNVAIEPFDLTVVLCNLFDNAINALADIEGRKLIILKIRYNRGLLHIEFCNDFCGVFDIRRDCGQGLRNVMAAAAKYDGTLKIVCEGGLFSAVVTMYVESEEGVAASTSESLYTK